jgi:hypothetical protein
MLIKYDNQALYARIDTLRKSLPEVVAAAVISVDGLIMASALPPGVSEDRISAMSAAMLSLGQQINKEMGLGALDQLYTRGSNGYVVLLAVGSLAVFTALVKPEAKMGVLFLELRKAADDLTHLLDCDKPPA